MQMLHLERIVPYPACVSMSHSQQRFHGGSVISSWSKINTPHTRSGTRATGANDVCGNVTLRESQRDRLTWNFTLVLRTACGSYLVLL
jgi:hypothetical protein